MTSRLQGLHVLVVGGGSGIGRAATVAYADEGASVTVLERSADAAAALQEAYPSITVMVGDGTDAATVEAAVEAARAPGGGLDHLTCCVGVFDHYASLRTLSTAELESAADEMWRVNVLGTFVAVKLAHAALEAAKGSVTLTLSESAFGARGGGFLYGSSKWALRGAVQHLAADLAPEVRVNAVAPGGTSRTSFSGLSSLDQAEKSVDLDEGRDARIAQGNLLRLTPTPEDHAAAYLYLADPVASRVVTGAVLHTDGGGTGS